MVIRAAFATCVLLSTVAVVAAANESVAAVSPVRWTNVARVVVFGDVHGAYAELVKLLRVSRVVDADSNWVAGTTHLVSLGDLLDRGPKSRQVLDLVMRLQRQAEQAGGAVHVVLGNHEFMNLTGDLRYLVPDDYAAFASDETAALRIAAFDRYRAGRDDGQSPAAAQAAFDAKYPRGYFARRAAFAATGTYGKWLASLPVVITIDDRAFLHGGLPPVVDEGGIEELNEHFHRDLMKLLALKAELEAAGYDAPDATQLAERTTGIDPALGAAAREFVALGATPLFADAGPLWYRGTALCHGLIEQSLVDRGLAALQAGSAVIGHTPTNDRRAQQRFAGKVVMLDTGMLVAYFHGHPAAWVIERGHDTLIYGDGGSATGLEDADAAVPNDGRPRAALEQFLREAPIAESRTISGKRRPELALQLRDVERLVPAKFVAGNKSQIAAELAAYRLDAILGLGMVPVTVARTVDGMAGVVATAPARVIDEAARREQQLVRPNWCARGNDYELMYAFDALIGNSRRSTADISYDQSTWQLELTGQSAAFPSTKTLAPLPAGVEPVLPDGFAKRLALLGVADVQLELGDLLNKQQLAALVARRDAILKNWKRAG